VAVDYGLFLVSRHREQLDTGMDVLTSAKEAEGTSGAAIVVAGTTVIISILGLYIVGCRSSARSAWPPRWWWRSPWPPP
jgi:RND superfamily putative drug exporter